MSRPKPYDRPRPEKLNKPLREPRTQVEVFVPLSLNPSMAHEQGFDSSNRIKDMIKKHLKNLAASNWIGASEELVPSTAQWITCAYKLGNGKKAVKLPRGMRVPAGYPERSISSFMGIIQFDFKNLDTWEDFKYFMQQSDSEGPTTDSWLSELNFYDAHVCNA